MLIVETIAKIRRMYFVDKKGIKAIARELRISKNTVRDIIRNDVIKRAYVRRNQPHPVLGSFLFSLDEKLTHDKDEPRRRQRKAMKLYKELRSAGYTGTYEAVNNYVKQWRLAEGKQRPTKVFVPLEFEPGEAFQFDWSEEEIELAGEIIRIKAAHIRLAHSRFFLVTAFFNEQLEMVMEAHNRAFEFFGGVCKKGLYDNMKTTVQKILVGKDRVFNSRFSEMASHYLFEPIACTPAAGWEKGQVEHQVETSRSNFFTPLVKVNSLDERLKAECLSWAQSTKYPSMKDKTTFEVYQEEKPFLLPVRERFDGCKVEHTTVSSYSLIKFDTNSYSVNCDYVGQAVEIRVYWNRIEVRCGQAVIGEHERCFKKHRNIYNPWHYVPVLERKPGALRNGAPFKQLALPAAVTAIRNKLLSYSDGEKQFIRLLLQAHQKGLEVLKEACQKAIDLGLSNVDWIESMMEAKMAHDQIKKLSPAISLIIEPQKDFSEYDEMLLPIINPIDSNKNQHGGLLYAV
ncbi:MAG: hypothetical protein A2103_05145 [Gammaproteobacteria bacterium GWF2_41_13]|nr:MAG: hypothetical protein A2103_05145 [Gammaproteobacteria bacterium GWF2_41_13]